MPAKPCAIIVIIFFSLNACKKESKPADVLSKEELSAVMIDLYLGEARINGFPINRDSSLRLFLPHESEILAKRNLPDSVLRKTYSYYLQHPEDFSEVYDIIIDSLTVREKRRSETPQK
jgi:hypothetical protein